MLRSALLPWIRYIVSTPVRARVGIYHFDPFCTYTILHIHYLSKYTSTIMPIWMSKIWTSMTPSCIHCIYIDSIWFKLIQYDSIIALWRLQFCRILCLNYTTEGLSISCHITSRPSLMSTGHDRAWGCHTDPVESMFSTLFIGICLYFVCICTYVYIYIMFCVLVSVCMSLWCATLKNAVVRFGDLDVAAPIKS